MTDTGTPATSRSDERTAWAIHIFTTLGIVAGMLALQAVLDRQPREAVLWLVVTQLIDGIDGPFARAYNVKGHLPKIDGYVLDLVIDFVTCVVVPAAFIHQFGLLPAGNISLALVGVIVCSGAIWFSRTDMMTDDHWFRGFPAAWNLVAPSLYLLNLPRELAAAIVVALALASLTDMQFPHPVRVLHRRTLTLSVTTVWLASLTALVIISPDQMIEVEALILVCPLYFFLLAFERHSHPVETAPAHG
jgi:phosphatidylcholine synthase